MHVPFRFRGLQVPACCLLLSMAYRLLHRTHRPRPHLLSLDSDRRLLLSLPPLSALSLLYWRPQ